MFSLIITIISIALVAALALATLYYGGGAFNKGSADAEASKIVLQGQQLLGAAELFFADKNRWPANREELITEGYLKAVPQAQLNGVSAALASNVEWTMVAGHPVFVLDTGLPAETCAAVNVKGSLGQRGILRQAYTSLNAQCYGESAFKVVFKKFTTPDSLAGLPAGEVATSPTPPTYAADPDAWTMEPGSTAPPGGGNPGGGDDEVPVIDPPGPVGPDTGWWPEDPGLTGPTWSVAVSEVNFGATPVGSSLVASIEFTNISDAPASLYEVTFADGLDFIWPNSNWSGPTPNWSCFNSVEPGATCNLELHFRPGTDGVLTDTATVLMAWGGTPDDITLPLKGTGLKTGPTPTGLLVHDRFNGTGAVASRMTDTNNNWYVGYWQSDWSDQTNDCTGGGDLNWCSALWLDGSGSAYAGYSADASGRTMLDQVADYHMPVRDYYVEMDVTVPADAGNSMVGLYLRYQVAPDPVWDMTGDFVDIWWSPTDPDGWAGIQINSSWGDGIGYQPETILPPVAAGQYTFRAVVFGDKVFVYVDGAPVAAYTLQGAHAGDAGYVGFGLWNNAEDAEGNYTTGIKLREFRAGTLPDTFTPAYADNLYAAVTANMMVPPPPPPPPMCDYPVYAMIHLPGGFNPARLGIDHFVAEAGWYDFNGTPTYYPNGWAYERGAVIRVDRKPCP